MKELTDLNIQQLGPSYDSLKINQNFQQIQDAIDLLQTTFGITIELPGFEAQNAKFLVDVLRPNSIKLPATGAVKIGLDGNDGGITGSSFNVINNAYVGGDLDLYNKNGTGGRVRFRVDRNTEITKPSVPGQVRFTGNSFQGYVYQNEVNSSFSFEINSGASGGTIAISINGNILTTTTWQGAAYLTGQRIVSDILAISNGTIKASSDATIVTLESVTGYASYYNSAPVVLTTNDISVTPSTGTMTGGIDGTQGWVNFTGYVGATGGTGGAGATGATGATGPSGGSSGTAGSSGTSGSSGSTGTSGSSGISGSSGSSGRNGSSGSSGTSGESGSVGPRGSTGPSGTSGTSGQSGSSGTSGSSGSSGRTGTSGSTGSSGTSGQTGTSGSSGTSGQNGTSGVNGTSGTSGSSGSTGTSGSTGSSGSTGTSGSSGLSGDFYATEASIYDSVHTSPNSLDLSSLVVDTSVVYVNTDLTNLAYTVAQSVIVAVDEANWFVGVIQSLIPVDGYYDILVKDVEFTLPGTYGSSQVWAMNLDGAVGPEGQAGTSGTAGTAGTSGTSGSSGSSGRSGSSGTSGSTGTSGSSGTSGINGSSGTSGSSGSSGEAGTSGSSGSTGSSGSSGQNGSSGSSGSTGSSGESGTSGSSGSSGQSGSSGSSGQNGSSGSSGQNGSSGSSGQNGSSGSSGQSGSSGSSGQTGSSGSSGQTGSSGSSGQSGSSGTSGVGGANGTSTQVAFFTAATTLGSDSGLYWDNTNKRLGVGLTSPGYPLEVSGNVSGISIYASHDIAAYSDISVKDEVEEIANAVEKIKQIRGVTFVRNDSESKERRAGVIAQEVEKVLPEVISKKEDGTLMVAYGNLTSLLIQAIKEQQVEIDNLKKIISEK